MQGSGLARCKAVELQQHATAWQWNFGNMQGSGLTSMQGSGLTSMQSKAVDWPACKGSGLASIQGSGLASMQASGTTLATCKAVGWPACKAVGTSATCKAVELRQNARQWVGQHARQWIGKHACYHCKKLFVACNLVSILDHRPLLLVVLTEVCVLDI